LLVRTPWESANTALFAKVAAINPGLCGCPVAEYVQLYDLRKLGVRSGLLKLSA